MNLSPGSLSQRDDCAKDKRENRRVTSGIHCPLSTEAMRRPFQPPFSEQAFQPGAIETELHPTFSGDNCQSGFNARACQSDFNARVGQSDFNARAYHTGSSERDFQLAGSESAYRQSMTEGAIHPGVVENGYYAGFGRGVFQPDVNKGAYQAKVNESGFQPIAIQGAYQPRVTRNAFQPEFDESTVHSDTARDEFRTAPYESGYQPGDIAGTFRQGFPSFKEGPESVDVTEGAFQLSANRRTCHSEIPKQSPSTVPSSGLVTGSNAKMTSESRDVMAKRLEPTSSGINDVYMNICHLMVANRRMSHSLDQQMKVIDAYMESINGSDTSSVLSLPTNTYTDTVSLQTEAYSHKHT